ncbi:MAG: RNA polymerase sigma factor [Thermoleophilia bacterium]
MTDQAPDTRELVRGLQAGSRDAFEQLYRDYHPDIYNLCARILCDREEAQDLTHDVFIKAFAQVPGAGSELKLRPWLYRVATNACFNALRSRKRRGGDPRADLDQVAAPADEFERARTAGLFEDSLSCLNERYRAALVLKDLHGLGSSDIATALAVSPATADVLVHRARVAFRKVYAGLAGEGVPAPANLALVLPALAVPPVLLALPAFPTVPPHTPGHLPDLSSVLSPSVAGPAINASTAAGPTGAGVLAKIGAALGTKIAITAAAATAVVSGGVAVHELRQGDARDGSVAAATLPRPEAARTDLSHDGGESGGFGGHQLEARHHARYAAAHDGGLFERQSETSAAHDATPQNHEGTTATPERGTWTEPSADGSTSHEMTGTHDAGGEH